MSPETPKVQELPTPTHYAYVLPDKSQLFQGDVLKRTPDLNRVLYDFHPYFAKRSSYTHFIVLTQSCDLARHGGKPPKAACISLAAVRPVLDAVLRKAKATLAQWQIDQKVLSQKEFNRLKQFMSNVINNNEPGFFYLHEDIEAGIFYSACAFLDLSVPIKAIHYDVCLSAKVMQLTDVFQAKLGWLVGSSVSRVGTKEWNECYGEKNMRRDKLASDILNATFATYDERQLKQAMKRIGKDHGLSPEALHETVKAEKLVSFKDRMESGFTSVLERFDLPRKICSVVRKRLQEDSRFRDRIMEVLGAQAREANETGEPGAGVDSMIKAVEDVVIEVCADPNAMEWTKIQSKLKSAVATDPAMSSLGT